MQKLAVLGLLYVCIWSHDIIIFPDSLALLGTLIALPVVIWLGWPWRFGKALKPFSKPLLTLSVALLFSGFLLDISVFLAAGWTGLAAIFARVHLTDMDWKQRRGLLVLFFLAFPWLTVQDMQLGWWFRITGAWATEQCFQLLGLDVIRHGVMVIIEGQTIAVEPACAGIHSLQAVLVAGAALGWLHLRSSAYFVFWLGCLPLVAWMSNTLRIILISLYGLHTTAEATTGAIHELGGWLIILLVFKLCGDLLGWIAENTHPLFHKVR